MPDLTSYTADELDALRVAVATELERRATVETAAGRLESAAHDALSAGVPAADLRAAVEAGITGKD